MTTTPSWLLTDAAGGTLLNGRTLRRWGRQITHRESTPSIAGYVCDSPHLPYLLDPIHDRCGTTARLWLSEVPAPRHLDPNRIRAAVWTTWDEWERPAWVGGSADVRVRLRMALLAAAESYPQPVISSRLRNLPLTDLQTAAVRVEKLCGETAAVLGCTSPALCQAAMAVRLAARRESGEPDLADRVARRYPIHAWYAAMAVACVGMDLSGAADAAVRQECGFVLHSGLSMTAAV